VTKSEQAFYERLATMQSLLTVHERELPTVSRGNVRDELDEIVRALAQEHATQLGVAMRGTSQTAVVRRLKEDLRICHIAPIIAVALSKRPGIPMVPVLRLPRKNAPTSELCMIAAGIVSGVAGNLEFFRKQEFPDDFIEQLLAAADAVRAAENEAASVRLEGVAATRSIAALVKRGRQVASVLDALVFVNTAGNRILRAEWRAMTALRRVPPGRPAAPAT
jgi:hypothetical protein